MSVGSYGPLGICPAGYRWIVRDLVVTNGWTAKARIQVAIFRSLAAAIGLWTVDIEAGATAHLDLRQTMYSGDELQGMADLAGQSIVITGYQFKDDAVRIEELPA